MSPSRIYLYHPPFSRSPHLQGWLQDVVLFVAEDTQWLGCKTVITSLDKQLSLNEAFEIGRIRRELGPVIFVEGVQQKHFENFRRQLPSQVVRYLRSPTDSLQILRELEETRRLVESGEPRVPKREMIAFRILSKLHRMKLFAGAAKNKDFIQIDDLVKGGFPKEVSKGEIRDLVDVLLNAKILSHKIGDGNSKYGLQSKDVTEGILAAESFDFLRTANFDAYKQLTKYFSKDSHTCPRSEMFYRDE